MQLVSAPFTRLASSVIPAGRKLDGLHGMRAIAASMIVIFHVTYLSKVPIPDAFKTVKTHFGLGVHIFFVLSAFSLAYSDRLTAATTREYLIKRFFRIAPLFYAMLVYYQVTEGIRPLGENLANLLFIFNFIPGLHQSFVLAGWTIGVEMVFYALLPIILATCRSLTSFAIFAVLALAASYVGRLELEQSVAIGGYPNLAFISNLWFFAIGLLAFAISEDERVRRLWWSGLVFGAIGILMIALLLTPMAGVLVLPGRPDTLLFGLAFACITVWQALKPSWLLRLGLMQFVGERSYSVYLLHPAVVVLLRKSGFYAWLGDSLGDWAIWAAITTTLAIVYLLSEVSYRLVEVPGIELGRRIKTSTLKRSARG